MTNTTQESKERLCDKIVPKVHLVVNRAKPQRSPQNESSLGNTLKTRRLYGAFGLCISVIVFYWSPVVIGLRNKFGSFTVISAKPCQNALGQIGTCMFMWDCIKSEGVHLGTCSDRFLFGSCCYHNVTNNDIDLQKITHTSQNETRFPTRQRPQTNLTSNIHSLIAQSSGNMHSTSILSNQADTELTHKTDLPESSHIQSNVTSASEDQSKMNDGKVASWQNKPNLNETKENQSNSWPPQLNSQGYPIHQNNIHNQPQKQSTLQISINGAVEDTSSASLQHTTTIAPVPQTNTILGSSTTSLPISLDPNDKLQSNHVLSQTSNYPSIRPMQNTLNMQSQTQAPVIQRPQSSLLSRPASMLANAIFHSFKPFSYLHSNKQRPTYKPGFSGYRPAAPQKPTTSLNQQLNRPSFFGMRPHNLQVEQMPAQSNYQNDTKLPANQNAMTLNSSTFMQDNNDHHVVNPSMIERIRPIDKTQLYDQNSSHKQNHYELLNTTNSSMSGEADKGGSTQAPVVQYETTNGIQLSGSLHGQMVETSVKGNSTHIYHTTSYESGPNNSTSNTNIGNGGYVGFAQTTQNHDQHQVIKPVFSLERPSIHHNETSDSYPLNSFAPLVVGYQNVQGGQADLVQPTFVIPSNQPQNLSPIDEIHGLSVSTFDPGSNENLTRPGSLSTQTNVQNVHQSTNQPDTLVETSQPVSTVSLSEQEQTIANDLSTTQATSSTGSITLLGNIDDHNALLTPEPTVITTFTPPPNSIFQTSVPTMATTTSSSTTTAFTMTTTPPEQTSGSPASQSVTSQAHHNQYIAPGSTPPRVTTSNSYNLDPNKRHGNGREATCGVTTLYPQTKVVGGKNAAFGAWPWQVSVRKTSLFGFTTTHRCGGAVISNEWIATAGHCVEDLPVQSIRLRVGEHDFSSTTEPFPAIERAARRKVVHPKYNVNTYENDLALVQLDRPLQFPPHVAPICLPPDDIDLLGKNATLTGWGRLNEGGLLPTILQEVRVPIVSNDECKDMFLRAGRQEYIPDIFLCAGYEEGGRDSCQGDSGGPLQVKGDDGKWFLAGIISWGIGCAEQNLPGVCTRISHFKLWIQSTIDSHS